MMHHTQYLRHAVIIDKLLMLLHLFLFKYTRITPFVYLYM